jgi:hypothetical protein
VALYKCNKKKNKNCKPDSEAELLIKEIYWNFFIAKAGVQLKNPQDPYGNPIVYNNEL